MSVILSDFWGNPVEITRSYVSYRNRLIDIHLIHTFQTKGRKLLINTYKQNQMIPTLCVFFEDKEKALDAYQQMKSIVYPRETSKKEQDPMMYILASILIVPICLAITMIQRSC